MAEKNIAALLREDAKTIRVTFTATRYDKQVESSSNKSDVTTYNYVTHLDVEVGDTVLVEANGVIKAVSVVNVDPEVQIPPNADFELRWVIAKVDLSDYEANMEKNRQIEELVSNAYRANLRRSFANQILSGIEDSERAGLLKLLGSK